MTAHPHVCPKTGEMLGFGYGQLPPYLVYHRISPDGKLVQSEEIEVPGPTMMHDFMITRERAMGEAGQRCLSIPGSDRNCVGAPVCNPIGGRALSPR